MVAYRFIADATVVLHLAYASFIVFGLAVILMGVLFKWSWVRNFWFRVVHLVMIGLVAAEAGLGIPCPLTLLENHLRNRAGQATYPGSFLGNLAHDLLFFDVPDYVISAVYVLFFAAVVVTFVWARPRWPGSL